MGIITFSTELWNPELAAGIADPAKYQVRARSTEDELKLLQYNDEHLGGKGFVNWAPFDHPQLGRIEIGGWTHMYTFRNPPPASWATSEKARAFLHDTLHNNCLFTLNHAACTPLLRFREVEVAALGANLYKISVVVSNQGFLPTHMTQMALKNGTVGSVYASVDLPEGVELIMGESTQQIGHLAGRDERTAPWSPWLREWTQTAKRVEWLVRAPAGTEITVMAQAERAGTQRQKVTLS
jgi:hypothetical protein